MLGFPPESRQPEGSRFHRIRRACAHPRQTFYRTALRLLADSLCRKIEIIGIEDAEVVVVNAG